MVITWSEQSDGTVNWAVREANFANCQMTRKSHGGLDQLSQSGTSILEKRTATGTEPTLIWQNNKACILLSKNESSSAGRCKHIDTKIRSVAEAISDGVVKNSLHTVIIQLPIQLRWHPHEASRRRYVSQDDRWSTFNTILNLYVVSLDIA